MRSTGGPWTGLRGGSFFFLSLFFTVMDALLGRMNQLILNSGSDYFGAASSHFSIFFFTSLDLN